MMPRWGVESTASRDGAERSTCGVIPLFDRRPNLKRLVDEIGARPAAQRAVALKDRHKFKTEMDDESRKALFRHLTEKVA